MKRELDYVQAMREQGLRKRTIALPNGRVGYTWERFRDATEAELAEAHRGFPKTPARRSEKAIPIAEGLNETANWLEKFLVLDEVKGILSRSGKALIRAVREPVNTPAYAAEEGIFPSKTDPSLNEQALDLGEDPIPLGSEDSEAQISSLLGSLEP